MSAAPPSDEELPLGAHLVSPRLGYLHHGIYVGRGRVIHYAGFHRALRRGPIEEVTLDEFARGRPWQVRSTAERHFAGPAAAERARSRLGEQRYRLWSNNCEHFANWVVSGDSRSEQVDALATQLKLSMRRVATWLVPRPERRQAAH